MLTVSTCGTVSICNCLFVTCCSHYISEPESFNENEQSRAEQSERAREQESKESKRDQGEEIVEKGSESKGEGAKRVIGRWSMGRTMRPAK